MIDKILSFNVCGLILDACGVWLLGMAFFFKTKEVLLEELANLPGINPHALRGSITSKIDGQAGTVLLFIGFIYQMIGSFQIKCESLIIISYYFLVLFLLLYFLDYRRLKVEEWARDIQNRN